jgi:Hint domain
MPIVPVWMLDKLNITVSGGGDLSGITQGAGTNLVGSTITLNNNQWRQTFLNDDDANFDDNDTTQRLSGAQTINGVTYANNTVVEAEYTLTLRNPATGQTWKVIGYNVNNSNPAYGTIEGLAFIGPPAGWPPVGLALTVVSAAEGPGAAGQPATPYTTYVAPPCFTPGTMIDTPVGPRLIETLTIGDLVCTLDNGPQPLVYLTRAHLPFQRLQADPAVCPIIIPRHAFGPGLPMQDLRVSPQHRFLIRSVRAELLFSTHEVLVAAQDLAPAIRVPADDLPHGIDYIHLMFDTHQILRANGVETESFLVGPAVLSGAPALVQAELLALFSNLARPAGPLWQPSARTALSPWEARCLAA